MEDTEAIERATLEAVAPQAQEEHAGWLLAYDDGTVGRARSAVPLRHEAPPPQTLQEIAGRYRDRHLPPVFRVPDVPAFEAMHAALAALGYAAGRPTLVQTGTAAPLMQLAPRTHVDLAPTVNDTWIGVSLGDGLAASDRASRAAVVRRARKTVFARIQRQGAVVAVGAACFSEGWCGVHGMRTLATHRRQGLAGAILSALARTANERGIDKVFLQVEEGNATARSLYARGGLRTAWGYRYWE